MKKLNELRNVKEHTLPVEIHIDGQTIQSETFDISKTGLFIKVDDQNKLQVLLWFVCCFF